MFFAAAKQPVKAPIDKFGNTLAVPVITSPLNGLYLGVAVALSLGNGRNTTSTSVDLPTGAGPINSEVVEISNDNLNERSNPVFGLDIGYGLVFRQRFYTGLEFFAATRNQQSESRVIAKQQDSTAIDYSIENEVRLKVDGIEYGFRLRPGYLLTPNTLMYFVVGYIQTRFRLKLTTTYNNRTAGDAGSTELIATQGLNGIEFGVGMEYAFTQNISVRA